MWLVWVCCCFGFFLVGEYSCGVVYGFLVWVLLSFVVSVCCCGFGLFVVFWYFLFFLCFFYFFYVEVDGLYFCVGVICVLVYFLCRWLVLCLCGVVVWFVLVIWGLGCWFLLGGFCFFLS